MPSGDVKPLVLASTVVAVALACAGLLLAPTAGADQLVRRFPGIEFEGDGAVAGVEDDHGFSYLVSTTKALLTMIFSTGTSLGKGPPAPVGVTAILFTTSIPSTTLPKTV